MRDIVQKQKNKRCPDPFIPNWNICLKKKTQLYANLDEVKKIVRKIIGNAWRKVLKENINSIDSTSPIIPPYLELRTAKTKNTSTM